MAADEQLYEELRPRAFAIAYRMLGSVAEAEDVVQEGMLRLHRALGAGEEIASPAAYLATVVTRLAIDELRSARVRREAYVGEWLPEPLVTPEGNDPAVRAELADSLSLAFLVLLESLTPEQRAVFLLREVFDYPYDRIAEIVGKGEDATRQLAVRARRESGAAGRASSPSPNRRSASPPASSPPPRRAISARSRRCSPRTSSSTATAAAGRPRSSGRSSGASGSRGSSATGGSWPSGPAAWRFAASA